jgi:hypothetical protein
MDITHPGHNIRLMLCPGHNIPGKDFMPWVYALYRVNKRVLTRKIEQFRVTLRDITP